MLRRGRALARSAPARSALALAILLAGLALALVLSLRPGDPALFPGRPGDEIDILVVSNGFHSGLILPTQALRIAAAAQADGALVAVTTRFGAYPWIEAGWGDRAFYRAVPNASAFDWRLGLHALFAPGNPSVMHVVGLDADPALMKEGPGLVRLHLTKAGFARLTTALDRSFARDALGLVREIGPGLSGPSLFYEGVGTFSLVNLCNHWTTRMLDSAGVPTAPALATLPASLIWDLRRRALQVQAVAEQNTFRAPADPDKAGQ